MKIRLGFVLSVNRCSLRFFVFVAFIAVSRFLAISVVVSVLRLPKRLKFVRGWSTVDDTAKSFLLTSKWKHALPNIFLRFTFLLSESFLPFRELVFRFVLVKFVENQLSYEVVYLKQGGGLNFKIDRPWLFFCFCLSLQWLVHLTRLSVHSRASLILIKTM